MAYTIDVKYPILISHRGNLIGKQPHKENSPEYVVTALLEGYQVEVDIWLHEGNLFLGHDNPQYPISDTFLQNANLWIHAKNADALNYFVNQGKRFHYFWHNEDDYTITSKGYIWAYPGRKNISNTISVLPERDKIKAIDLIKDKVVGICSDVIVDYKNMWRDDFINDMMYI